MLILASACTEVSSPEPAPPSGSEKPVEARDPYPEVPSLSDHVTAILESATDSELFNVDLDETRREQENFPPPVLWAIEDRMTSISIERDLEPEFSALFAGVGLRRAEK